MSTIAKLAKEVRTGLYRIREVEKSLKFTSSIADVNALAKELNCLGMIRDTQIKIFKYRAASAQKAANVLAEMDSGIDQINKLLVNRFESTYEHCRKMANRANSRKALRAIVFEKSNFMCAICGEKNNLTVDHIVPVKQGGKNNLENLQCLCLRCNCKKGSN